MKTAAGAKATKSGGPARAGSKAARRPARAASAALLVLQQKAGNGAVGGMVGRGRRLDAAARAAMEERLGADFSGVRIHTGAEAQAAASDELAHAYTVGSDIVFGEGEWQSGTAAGQNLLAHELAHVVQQTQRAGPRVTSGAHEREAARAARGGRLGSANAAAPVSIQRQEKTPDELRKEREAKLAAVNEELGRGMISPERIEELKAKRARLERKLYGFTTEDKQKYEAAMGRQGAMYFGLMPSPPPPPPPPAPQKEPLVSRLAEEEKAKERHRLTQAVAPPLAKAFEKDPKYMKAMGVYAEEPQPVSYEGVPDARLPAAIKDNIAATRNLLQLLMDHRKSVDDSSIVVRKAAEGWIGVQVPPKAKLNEAMNLLKQAEEALAKNDVGAAKSLHEKAAALQREAAWYWSRYREIEEYGGQKAIELLSYIRDGAKIALTVLSMGGGGAVALAGTLGGAAINFADAYGTQAMGGKVNWTALTVETAIQIALVKFQGPLANKLAGSLMKNAKLSGVDSKYLANVVLGVLGNLSTRAAGNAARVAGKDMTWDEFMDQTFAPGTIMYDVVLNAVMAKLQPHLEKIGKGGAGGTGEKPAEAPAGEGAGKDAGKSTGGAGAKKAGPLDRALAYARPRVAAVMIQHAASSGPGLEGGRGATDVAGVVEPANRPAAGQPPGKAAAGAPAGGAPAAAQKPASAKVEKVTIGLAGEGQHAGGNVEAAQAAAAAPAAGEIAAPQPVEPGAPPPPPAATAVLPAASQAAAPAGTPQQQPAPAPPPAQQQQQPRAIWEQGRQVRGLAYEGAMGKMYRRMGPVRRVPKNFPGIDFVANGRVQVLRDASGKWAGEVITDGMGISEKTLDLRNKSMQSAKGISRAIRNHIEKLYAFDDATLEGIEVKNLKDKVLNVAIGPGKPTPEQQQGIQDAIDHAKLADVIINIFVF